ncbi:MAG: saccharopine dehydrogenase NADP-binding domain-containing protein [Bacteroidia bacterium]|nr:saccharopine dehydrogenase NADP-binding domain-containing protein [Bacteroidia bacterium]
MKKITVLGAGMVGRAMALDLAPNFAITAADLNPAALTWLNQKNPAITTVQADLSDAAVLQKLIAGADLVLSAVPGFMGFKTLKTILEAGKNVVDISFFPENSLDLDVLAKAKGLTALVDIGVAPGMDNIFLGYWNERMKITSFECLVGGLPKARKWPFQYKAPFSPADVIEEYTRPARYVENFNLVTREALSDPELLEFEGVGTLESFNTDGLRSIIFTMPHIPNMKEKTLRYPGHIEYVRVLRETGFFSTEPVEIGGQMVSPLALSSKLLFKEWKLGDTEPELTVMRVTLQGEQNGQPKTVVYHLHDEYDPATQTSSMARTTGYTATGAVNMYFEGLFQEKGVFPPELVGKHAECTNYLLKYLEKRNIRYQLEEK